MSVVSTGDGESTGDKHGDEYLGKQEKLPGAVRIIKFWAK
jgi:hypothetical protein